MTQTQATFLRRALIAVGLVALTVVVLLGAWTIIEVLLLVFAGMLLAIFLSGLARWVHDHSPLSYRWSLGLVLVLLLALASGFIWWVAPTINKQVMQLRSTVPEALQRLEAQVADYAWGQRLIDQTPSPQEWLQGRQSILTRITGIFSVTFSVVTNLVIILFVGLYLAFEPSLYKHGIVRLFPLDARPRVAEVLGKVGGTLHGWIMGMMVSMSVIGVLTALSMWLLNIPLALLLGVIAGLLTFIPNIGPIVSAVPAVLLGLVQSPMKALYVILAYVAIQTLESYLITPMVMRKMIKLPPALIIVAQVAMGILFGLIGLVVATPLVVSIMVLVQTVYVRGVLNDPQPFAGED